MKLEIGYSGKAFVYPDDPAQQADMQAAARELENYGAVGPSIAAASSPMRSAGGNKHPMHVGSVRVK